MIGTGAWGTVLAILLQRTGAETVLLARTPEEATALAGCRENRRFLPGVPLPAELAVSADAARGLANATLVVIAVPVQRLRENLERRGDRIPPAATLLCGSKGIELGTGLRPSQVIAETLGERPGAALTLSGPNLSGEIAAGLPAATVVAGPAARRREAAAVQRLLSSERLRVYTSTDQAGVELGGALKNVIAIACGICDGLGYGHNARAGLVTRGLAEMTRLTVAAGGRARTLAGLAGLGDLMATVASASSRNYSLGLAIGRGAALSELQAAGPHVAEGVPTTTAALSLAARLGVEMPVTATLAQVLDGTLTPRQGAAALMQRALTRE